MVSGALKTYGANTTIYNGKMPHSDGTICAKFLFRNLRCCLIYISQSEKTDGISDFIIWEVGMICNICNICHLPNLRFQTKVSAASPIFSVLHRLIAPVTLLISLMSYRTFTSFLYNCYWFVRYIYTLNLLEGMDTATVVAIENYSVVFYFFTSLLHLWPKCFSMNLHTLVATLCFPYTLCLGRLTRFVLKIFDGICVF